MNVEAYKTDIVVNNKGTGPITTVAESLEENKEESKVSPRECSFTFVTKSFIESSNADD